MASYNIGSPATFQGANNFTFRALTGELNLDTDTQTSAIKFMNNGEIVMLGPATLDNGSSKIRLRVPAGLTGDYDIEYPDNPPAANQVMKYSGGQLIWEDLYVSVDQQFIVRKNPNAGEYGNVRDAVNAAAAASPTDTNRLVVYIYPGVYVETATITVPSYVHLVGESLEAVIIEPSGNFNMFVFTGNCTAEFFSVRNVQTGFYGMVFQDMTEYALCHKVDIYDSDRAVLCKATSVDTYVYFEYCAYTACTTNAIRIESSGGFTCYVSVENHFIDPPCIDSILIYGDTSILSGHSCVFTGDGTNDCINQYGGSMNLRGVFIDNFAVGMKIDVTAVNPQCLLSGLLFDNCTQNISIDSATATGNFDGYSEYMKTYINPASAFFITEKDNNVVTVAKKGGDFTSIKDAIDSITGATSTNLFYVYVGPGIYAEDPIEMKSYVSLTGFVSSNVTISANDTTNPLITMAPESTLQSVSLTGATGSSLIKYTGDALGRTIYLKDLFMKDADTLVDIDSSDGVVFLNMKYCQVRSSAAFSHGIAITSNATNAIFALIDSLSWSSSTGVLPTDFFHFVSGSAGPINLYLYITNVLLGQSLFPAAGTGVICEGACSLAMTDCAIAGFTLGMSIPATTVTAPTMNLQVTTFEFNTNDLNIANTATSGVLNITATRTKITIANSSAMSILVRDIVNGDFVVSGDFYQGGDFSTIVNVTPAIQSSVGIGINSGGTFSFVGTSVTVVAGTGYLLQSGLLKYVTWATQSLALPTGSSYFWIDNAGTLTSGASLPSTLTIILIGRAFMNGVGTIYVQRIAKDGVQLSSKQDTTFRLALGVLFISGCITSAGTSGLKISVSSGSYFYATILYSPAAVADASFIAFYNSGATYSTLTEIPLQYDNAGVLTAIPVGKWVKHILYVVGDGADQKYLFVYGQELFNLELDAQNGNLPTPPSFFGSNVAELCGIIVTDSDVGPLASNRFRDIRNIRGANRISGATASADHNSLLNLTVGNPHTQYLQKGGDTMSGTLNMGTNPITNCTTYNGITVESISSRLIPGGADALPTAAPSTVGTANSAGIATSFSRSDHVHAHGSQTDGTLHAAATGATNGFMSSADKTKLDNATSSNTVSTLVLRNGSGQSNFGSVGIVNAFTAQISGSGTQPADYTLTLPDDTGSAGQILQTDGTGVLSWATTIISDPMTTVGDMIIRDGTNTTARLPIGGIGNQLAIQGGIPTWREPITPLRETILFDDFNGPTSPFGDTIWSVVTTGTVSTTSALPATSTGVYGCTRISFSTATATWGLSKNLTTSFYFGLGTAYIEFGVYIDTLADILNQYIFRGGFGDATSGTTDHTDGVYFEYNIATSVNWLIKTAAGGVRTTTTSGTAVTTGWHKFAITASSSSVSYTLDGVSLGSIATNIPAAVTQRCGPVIRCARSLGATIIAYPIYTDYFYYHLNFSANRY